MSLSFDPWCKCGERWFSPTHTMEDVPGGVYRLHPGKLEPWRQWGRENLPSASDKFVFVLDDGFVRRWTERDSVGWVAPTEWKTHGAEVGFKDTMTMRALFEGELMDPIMVRLDGNTPGRLRHWPESCQCCGLPEPEIVSGWIEVNGERVLETDLVAMLLGEQLVERAA